MKIPPVLQILSVWLLVVILGAAMTMTRAHAVEADAGPELGDDPATISRIVEPVMETLSVSQCGSGYFCVWPSPNYVGTPKKYSAQSKYLSITLSNVGSFYNNRSKRAYLYGDSSRSPSACYGPRAKKASTTGWMRLAEGTYLSTAASC
jgi:hypothetical protein